MDKLQAQLNRIEAKLDALISALAEDDETVAVEKDLDGNDGGKERDDDEPL